MIDLNITSLAKFYGSKKVFSELNFWAESSVTGIAGRNGSGKSTLLKCISGLLKPTKGTISWTIDGHKISRKTVRKSIGFVAPYVQLYEELTVRENLLFILHLRESGRDDGIDELLEELDAGSFSASHFGELSTGQQQRVKLAAALIHKPRILILDEPGSNLDEKGKRAVQTVIDRHRNNRFMILLASNQSAELDLCDNILDLNELSGSQTNS
jgi:ABC-type multidrug transport system ATPase subunit